MKLNKFATIMLIFALVFTIATLFLLPFSLAFVINSLVLIYTHDPSSGVVIYFNHLYYVSFLYLILTACLSAAILPFDIILLRKMRINTWYTKALLIFSILSLALSLLLIFSLPAIYTL
ncbi:MAG TPA: hypothetical protein GX010_02490 [Erysipelotrichaceae bacterium]|nr:hypothetical protein [Erysipelotrichaceae bacterium]